MNTDPAVMPGSVDWDRHPASASDRLWTAKVQVPTGCEFPAVVAAVEDWMRSHAPGLVARTIRRRVDVGHEHDPIPPNAVVDVLWDTDFTNHPDVTRYWKWRPKTL